MQISPNFFYFSLVLKSSVEYLCDPHIINSTLMSWLKHRENIRFKHTRYFSYAATYEEFFTIIDKCEDLEQLKYLRYKIMTEIMDVTAIMNIQKHQGVDTHDDALPRTKSKGDLLRSRNLPRYLNQVLLIFYSLACYHNFTIKFPFPIVGCCEIPM